MLDFESHSNSVPHTSSLLLHDLHSVFSVEHRTSSGNLRAFIQPSFATSHRRNVRATLRSPDPIEKVNVDEEVEFL